MLMDRYSVGAVEGGMREGVYSLIQGRQRKENWEDVGNREKGKVAEVCKAKRMGCGRPCRCFVKRERYRRRFNERDNKLCDVRR